MGKLYLKDFNGNPISYKVPEEAVYDDNNVLLSSKLNDINTFIAKTQRYLEIGRENESLYQKCEYFDDSYELYQSQYNNTYKNSETGKTGLINAVRAKGVNVNTDASYDEIANSISLIESGEVFINGSRVSHYQISIAKSAFSYEDVVPSLKNISKLPNNCTLQDGSVVYLNGFIYALGVRTTRDGTPNGFYKYDVVNDTWSNLGTLPSSLTSRQGAAFVTNNKYIHYFEKEHHYVYDGTKWETDSKTIVNGNSSYYKIIGGIYNKDNKRFYLNDNTGILGGYRLMNIYFDSDIKFISTISSEPGSTSPISFKEGVTACVGTKSYNHIISGYKHVRTSYFTSFSYDEYMPTDYDCSSVKYPLGISMNDDDFIVFGPKFPGVNYLTKTVVYYYNETKKIWKVLGELPYELSGGSAVYDSDNKKIYVIGGNYQTGSDRAAFTLDFCIGDEVYMPVSVINS